MAKSKAGWSRSLLAAALVAAGFPPFGIWPLTFVGFVVFLIPFFEEVFFAKENKSRLKSRESAQYFAFFSFFVNCFGFYWLAYTLKEFGGMPWVLAIFLCLLIFVLFSVIPFVVGIAWSRVLNEARTRKFRPLWILSYLFALLLFLDAFDLRLFPWSPAMCVGESTAILPSVYYLGTWGWRLIFFSSVMLFSWAWVDLRYSSKVRGTIASVVVMLVLFTGYGVGALAKKHLEEKYSSRQPVALIQGNVGNYEKKLTKLGVMPTIRVVMKIHETLMQQIVAHNREQSAHSTDKETPELWVAWPETSFPGFPLEEGVLRGQLLDWTMSVPGLHLVGAYENAETDFAGQKSKLDFNITALFHSTLGYVSHARKMIRLPFGEYIPFDDYFPFLYDFLPQVNHFGKGLEPAPLAHPDPEGPVFVPAVCYEILYEHFVDRYVAAAKKMYPGRNIVLINPTNDSWYGPTSEPFQHSLLARWASVRQGLPSLRPTNTGLSQVIAPWGEVLSQGPQDESTVIFGELPVVKTEKVGQNIN